MLRINQRRGAWLAIALALGCTQAEALEWEKGDLSVTWNNRVSSGAAWRMQDIDYELVGKLSVPGQAGLCFDDCLSLNGDPAPNQRLVDARGAFLGVNGDNGNLNYQQYDVVAATTKLDTDLTARWNDWVVRVRGLAYYDPANVNFDETHTYTLYQPARTPRADRIERRFARGGELLEAFVQYNFEWAERLGSLTVGNQIVRWGESTLVQINSLAEINPPNAGVLRMPGSEINQIFRAVPMALLATDLVENVAMEAFYQLAWRPVRPDPAGSFFSDLDIIAGGYNATVSLGQFGEDPDQQFIFGNTVLGYLSSSTLTVYPQETEARDDGQYGLRLNYFADWLNGGTELNFYYMHYHSRLPYADVIATDDSCARYSGGLVEALVDCNGFNGGSQQLPRLDLAAERGEPLPIDTLQARVVYPEDIDMLGISFNTNLGAWSLAGEYSFRPNVPIQVHLTDLIFTGLQPAFPDEQLNADITGGALTAVVDALSALGVDLDTIGAIVGFPGIGSLLTATFPAAEVAVPSFLRNFRGGAEIMPGQYIRGYERMKVGQLDFTAIRAISGSNPLLADQILLISEVGMTQIYGMPSTRELQFETGYLNNTHAAPGADGTGQPDGLPDPRTFVPTQQRKGFATPISWGLRFLGRADYNDVVFGWTFSPTLVAAWDVQGTAPFPIQNFVEDRKEIVAGTEIRFTQAFSGRVLYQWFFGAGDRNTRLDRDNLAISATYTF